MTRRPFGAGASLKDGAYKWVRINNTFRSQIFCEYGGGRLEMHTCVRIHWRTCEGDILLLFTFILPVACSDKRAGRALPFDIRRVDVPSITSGITPVPIFCITLIESLTRYFTDKLAVPSCTPL